MELSFGHFQGVEIKYCCSIIVLTIVPLVENKEKVFPLLLSATMLAFVAKGLKYTMFGAASEVGNTAFGGTTR